jgi:hypothetical protein
MREKEEECEKAGEMKQTRQRRHRVPAGKGEQLRTGVYTFDFEWFRIHQGEVRADKGKSRTSR